MRAAARRRAVRAGRATSPGQLTVDELSARSGVSSRTIRFYQTEDILPAPLRLGRIALYGEEHVERLRLVSMLQSRGLRLSAIREVLRRGRPESSMRAWLGLDETLRAPWTDDEPSTMSGDDVQRLLAKHGNITAAGLLGAGLLRENADGGYVAPSPALLHIALQLDAAGVDVGTAADAARIIRQRLGPAAEELVALFAERAGQGFGREATPDQLARALDTLRPLGGEAVRIVFAQEVQRAIAGLLATPTASPPGQVRSAHVDRRSREGRRLVRSRPRR